MPEFEDANPSQNAESYTPSTDAKPRSRRRSGGFKKEQTSSAPKGNIGEVDPSVALKGERLSGGESAPEKPAPKQKTEAPKPSHAESTQPTSSESSEHTRATREEDYVRKNPEPSEATLAALKRVEARLLERKAGRDARYEARKKERDQSPNKKNASRDKRKPAAKAKQGGGFFAGILKLFGLGPKPPAKRSGNRGGRRRGGNRGGNGGGRRRNPQGGNRRR